MGLELKTMSLCLMAVTRNWPMTPIARSLITCSSALLHSFMNSILIMCMSTSARVVIICTRVSSSTGPFPFDNAVMMS